MNDPYQEMPRFSMVPLPAGTVGWVVWIPEQWRPEGPYMLLAVGAICDLKDGQSFAHASTAYLLAGEGREDTWAESEHVYFSREEALRHCHGDGADTPPGDDEYVQVGTAWRRAT